MKKKLAIIVTHPIQYYAPVFQLLAERGLIDIKVFYTWGEGAKAKFDPDFKRAVDWDIPLLDGYKYEFVANSSKDPGSHSFFGIKNPKIIDAIETYSPDAILVYGWAYHSHLKIMRHFRCKCHLMFRGDSNLLEGGSTIKRFLRQRFLSWVYSSITTALYVGSQNKRYFKYCGLDEQRLVFAPHSTDNNRFGAPREEEAKILRSKLGIEEEAIVILFAGKFQQIKNVSILLEAFIKANVAGCHLLLVGNGELEEELKKTSNNRHNVHFLEFQNQSYLPVIYQAADIFCLPSLHETWGLAVNEAMAAGNAILASRTIGCAVDLVEEGGNGYVFDPTSVSDLQDNMEKLCADRIKLMKMKVRGKELIRNWSFEKQVEAIEACVIDHE
ncbi:glycosyltransferase family 4 protein [Aridibaculum aurantiacum]|uniref:glycosyltransferase family 4 protein n=1 Tax=Aridibaculum aurantiacum TaxID=2810307 RepID=UPI001A9638A9|nr:glycosyltransferase family 4 protein [Aridibaculum aurantiacum]